MFTKLCRISGLNFHLQILHPHCTPLQPCWISSTTDGSSWKTSDYQDSAALLPALRDTQAGSAAGHRQLVSAVPQEGWSRIAPPQFSGWSAGNWSCWLDIGVHR